MRTVTTVVIGAGHAGLAVSRCLTERSIDHVVLERGEIANSWRTERWDSLRLLTPNWQSRLPGFGYSGSDPDGFRTMAETVAFIEGYAHAISAPVESRTAVTSVRPTDGGYRIDTSEGGWRCRAVVLASGACNAPVLPPASAGLPPVLHSLSPMEYRNPGQLPDGGVLIVGASASGTQIADELHRSGRPVTLSVGEHVRAPRTYRGRDIQWWMDAAGILDERYDEVDDITRARNVPSLQLTGSDDRRTLDLNALTTLGVRLVGRLGRIENGYAQFSGALRNVCKMADLKMNRLLNTIDEWADENDVDADPPHRFAPTEVDGAPPLGLDLTSGEIKTVVWATGFRPELSWLEAPVFDARGRLRHDGGVVHEPGLYLMGIPFLRRRKSSLIDGAGADARDLTDHLETYLERAGRRE